MSQDSKTTLPLWAANNEIPFAPDVSKYLIYLKDMDMTEAEKNDFLLAMWPQMWHLVDCGFNGNIGEQLVGTYIRAVMGEENGLSSNGSITQTTPQPGEKEIQP
ncbi:MAG: hypothetical protein H6861_00390 [Rhodospirillales bacterium]|nr:hypothetical protein [Rhodospirillales bacterium]